MLLEFEVCFAQCFGIFAVIEDVQPQPAYRGILDDAFAPLKSKVANVQRTAFYFLLQSLAQLFVMKFGSGCPLGQLVLSRISCGLLS